MDTTGTLETLLSLGPVVTILVYVIYYLQSKLKISEEKLEELHKDTRESDKGNIILLDKLSNALDKLSDRDDTNTEKVITELINLRTLIFAKLEGKE